MCRLDTSRHFRSHLRAPRGRGGWLFEDQAGQVVFSSQGTYGEASRAARVWGNANGFFVLYVCP